MSKILTGIVVPSNMQDTIIVEVTRRTPHPLYKKLLKRTKRYKVAADTTQVVIGSTVQIIEAKPVAKDKHFILLPSNGKNKNSKVK